jgi:hypothetical protein
MGGCLNRKSGIASNLKVTESEDENEYSLAQVNLLKILCKARQLAFW